MKIYKVNDDFSFHKFQEQDFKQNNIEKNLENWIENNPDSLLEDTNILIIGRQVLTKLGSYIDLLGIDKSGDLVVIELKRDRTPRDCIAQIIEYAADVNELTYDEIESLFFKYAGH